MPIEENPRKEDTLPFPLTSAEIAQYNAYVQKITDWYETMLASGQTVSLPKSLNPLIVRQLVELHVPAGAPPLGLENVIKTLNDENARQSELVTSGKHIFQNLTLGVEAVMSSHGRSLEGVSGYTDEIDTTRRTQNPFQEIISQFNRKAGQEQARYRMLSWDLSPLTLAGKSIPQKQIIRSTRETGAQEVGLHSYELLLIDQTIPTNEQNRKERRGRRPTESCARFAALFDETTNEIQGLNISWEQLPEQPTNDKVFMDFLSQKSPQLAQFVQATMIHPDWPAVHNVVYNLRIDLGENGIHARPPRISVTNIRTRTHYGGEGDFSTDKPAIALEEYEYNPSSELNLFVAKENTNPDRTISIEEYKRLLEEIREIFPKEVIKV